MKPSRNLRELRNIFEGKIFTCKKDCFECCTGICISLEEKELIDYELRQKGIKNPPQGKGENYCEYLNEKGECIIYENRPVTCRAYGHIKTPLLTCPHNKKEAEIIPPDNFINYMRKLKTSYVLNKVEQKTGFIEGLKTDNKKSLMDMAMLYVNMIKDGRISKEDGEIKLKEIEIKLNRQGDSIYNYFTKKPPQQSNEKA